MKSQPSYHQYTTRATFDKAINSLIGIVEGISMDGLINDKEIDYLNEWVGAHEQYGATHPFNELVPRVKNALADGVLSEEEHADIMWLCDFLRSNKFYDEITIGLQRLQGIMGGIASDGVITPSELMQLSEWMSENEHLRTHYPFDEMDSLIVAVLSDGKVDAEENALLLSFMNDFKPHTGAAADPTIISPVRGLCAVAPSITFQNARFCFTGESNRYTRDQLSGMVVERGGRVVTSVSKALNYLVVGADGNPYWKYACYGRKVEQAAQLRKDGHPILIVHENDFHDAIA